MTNIVQLSSKSFLILFAFLYSLSLPRAIVAQAPCAVQSETKVALVIGNSYSGVAQVSGKEDARVMSQYLCQIGFSVITVLDGNLQTMTDGLDALRERIRNAEKVIFFYSGHGYQVHHLNYLLPFGLTAIDPANPQVSLERVFWSLGGAPDEAVKLVLLDACRSTVNLPVKGGGTLGGIEGWEPGLSEPTRPKNMVLGFATDYGQTAESGPPKGFSPYSSALLRSIREPGLDIRDLLGRVQREVSDGTGGFQITQSKGLDEVGEFFLREPILVPAVIPEGPYSNLLVILNGKMVLDSSQKPQDRLRLKAGENDLLLLVSNGTTYRKGHTWERTGGWNYRIDFELPDGTRTFKDGENVPFKDGPHHGKTFTVARAKILVDATSAETALPPNSLDDKVWDREIPLWAQDQDLLYEKKIKALPLDEILDPATLPDFGILPAPTVLFLLREILTTGKFLGQEVADPERTFFVVRGNKAFKNFVKVCVEDRMKDRIKDLRVSLAAALRRDPRPFDSFDQSLNHCLRDVAEQNMSPFPRDDLKVWTLIEDRSDDDQPDPIITLSNAFGHAAVSGVNHGQN